MFKRATSNGEMDNRRGSACCRCAIGRAKGKRAASIMKQKNGRQLGRNAAGGSTASVPAQRRIVLRASALQSCLVPSGFTLEQPVVTPRRQTRQGFSVRYRRWAIQPAGDFDTASSILCFLASLAPWRDHSFSSSCLCAFVRESYTSWRFAHSGPQGQPALRRVRCADHRPRGDPGGRNDD